jgi:acetyltransferase-like isoleucine patch superfamily enzyme
MSELQKRGEFQVRGVQDKDKDEGVDQPPVLEHDWFPCPVPSNVRMGERSWLYSALAFMRYTSQRPYGVDIGHDSGIYKGTYFDLGVDGEVQIGNYCTVVGATINSNARITVGDYSFISHQVVLADHFASTPHRVLSNANFAGDVAMGIVIGTNVWIGARAVVLGGARIGECAIIGAAAVVDFEVPPYAIVAGNPARIVGWARNEKSSSPHK